ncbi:17384_t:CDS:2, partial [Dentiscutata erythropus]
PEVFKMACLRDVQKLFKDRNPFFAGFGNRITDALSYRSVNVPSSRIFTIDSNGEVKLQLLSGYKSSYIDLSDLVDQMFPHIGSKWDTVYNDFNYWKPEMPEIELPPEIYDSLKASEKPQKVSAVIIDSPKRGMIQTLISGGSNGQTPTNSEPTSSSSSLKSYDNLYNKDLHGKRKQHLFYVGGD